MKTIVGLCIVLCSLTTYAAPEKLVPVRYAKGQVILNKSYFKKDGDSYKTVTEVACEKEIAIPVYEFNGNGSTETVPVSCDTDLGGQKVKATVYLGINVVTAMDSGFNWIPAGTKLKSATASLSVWPLNGKPNKSLQPPQIASFATENIKLENMWLFALPIMMSEECSANVPVNSGGPAESSSAACIQENNDTISAFVRIEDR